MFYFWSYRWGGFCSEKISLALKFIWHGTLFEGHCDQPSNSFDHVFDVAIRDRRHKINHNISDNIKLRVLLLNFGNLWEQFLTAININK